MTRSNPGVDAAPGPSRKHSRGGRPVGSDRGNATPRVERRASLQERGRNLRGASRKFPPKAFRETSATTRRVFFFLLETLTPLSSRAGGYGSDDDELETAPVTRRGGRPRGATLPPRDFSPRETRTRTRAAAVTPRELFSPSTHVHPRIGSHGRTILVNGPAVQADEKEPSDLKGRRVIWDLELLEEMIGRLACTSCRGCPSGAHARGCSRGPRPRHPPA
jgi:hypothetical protein